MQMMFSIDFDVQIVVKKIMGLSLQMNVKYQCSGLQRCSGVQISPLL